MRIGRLVLVVATLVTILVFPLMLRGAAGSLTLPSAYAASTPADAGGRVYQNGNNNDNGNNDDDDDDDDDDNENNNNESEDNENESGDNDNVVCYENLNDNDEVPCDFDDNDNWDNDNYYSPPSYTPPAAAPAPAPSASPMSRCFAPGESGHVSLMLNGGSVVVRVVPPGMPQGTWIRLSDVEPSTIPAPPGGAVLLGSMVWRMDSGAGCEGAADGQVVGDVNLGIPYNISADKSKLQIVYLQNGQWVEVNTVPDPSPTNPYISSTIRNTGVYAVIQKP